MKHVLLVSNTRIWSAYVQTPLGQAQARQVSQLQMRHLRMSQLQMSQSSQQRAINAPETSRVESAARPASKVQVLLQLSRIQNLKSQSLKVCLCY
jgi:hypothetical protein